jgi:hypothetical protein
MATPDPPPAPPGWNKTTRELFQEMREGKRSELGWPESEWAIRYERSLLPAGTRFPRKEDVYAATAAYTAVLLVSWRSPSTTDLPYTLPAGCQIKVESEASAEPISIYALPVEYKRVEKEAIPFWIRFRPDYAGYHLAVSTHDLNTRFTLVSSGA